MIRHPEIDAAAVAVRRAVDTLTDEALPALAYPAEPDVPVDQGADLTWALDMIDAARAQLDAAEDQIRGHLDDAVPLRRAS